MVGRVVCCLSGPSRTSAWIEFHVQGSRNHRASQTEEVERPEHPGPGSRSPGRPAGELPERVGVRVPESGHHARPADRLGHEEGSHPPCGHLVQPARSVMTARGRPARGRPVHLRATRSWGFGLPVLAAGRHWGSPVGSSSFALSLPTGPQVLFSDKRRPFLRPSRGGRAGGPGDGFPGAVREVLGGLSGELETLGELLNRLYIGKIIEGVKKTTLILAIQAIQRFTAQIRIWRGLFSELPPHLAGNSANSQFRVNRPDSYLKGPKVENAPARL